jgi:protoporphyrinogen oxidase
MRILILGAGPTGLGAAYQCQSLGHADWLLVEAAEACGGLASSFVDEQGFIWDVGGHVQFSHYDYFDTAMTRFLGQDGWFYHQREAWVWMRERFIPYPLQNNIHRLPEDDINECVQGLLEVVRRPDRDTKNFREWIRARFGEGLGRLFMEPYNFKVWAYPPELMNSSWVGERVAVVDVARVIRNVIHKTDDVSWGPNNTFQFPKRGGTGAIWRACAQQLPQDQIRLRSRVSAINLPEKSVILEDGPRLAYDALISTIPLAELVKITGQHQLISLAERGLLFSSSNIVGLGLKGQPGEELKGKCWIYFPEDDCPFYRVTVFSNYSPFNVPDHGEFWSLMFEVSESQHRPLQHERLLDEVIKGALNTKLIPSRDSIVSRWSYRAPHGYPTPGLDRDAALEALIPFFERHDVFSRGRFGMWKYEVSNQDHSFMQGVEVVERLLNGRTEITAFDPSYVNSRKHPWPFERWQ